MPRCPNCKREMAVSRYSCTACGAEATGTFPRCCFCALDEDDLSFLALFLGARGNLSDVAKTLSVSHPTARARLSKLLDKLDLRTGGDVGNVLDMLERNEITAEEAAKLIRRRR